MNRETLMERLATANDIRTRRAALKRDIASGTVRLRDVLEEDPPWIGTMLVRELLSATPGLGRARVKRVLSVQNIDWNQTLDKLTLTRRRRLLAWIAQAHPKAKI